jgi:hypothetical protein
MFRDSSLEKKYLQQASHVRVQQEAQLLNNRPVRKSNYK